MKLKCNDGIVRSFRISKRGDVTGHYTESSCLECHKYFGVHDTWLLKKFFREHTCETRI